MQVKIMMDANVVLDGKKWLVMMMVLDVCVVRDWW